MSMLVKAIQEWQSVLGICPCCGELFRLSEVKLILPHEKPKPSLYADLISSENEVSSVSDSISQEESLFEEALKQVKIERTEAGQRSAREKLKRIDPHFSGKGTDPRVVKVLFHPVEHVVFHCLDEQSDNAIELVSRRPSTRLGELTMTSIEHAVNNGNIEYELLRLQDDASFTTTTEFRRRKTSLRKISQI